MTLPVVNAPTYFTNIPSTGKKIKYRPFLVKEEKILLIAMQEKENDTDVIYEAIKQMIRNCTFDQVDVDKLASFDLDWLFLQLKIRSSGAEQDMNFVCNKVLSVNDKKEPVVCGQVNNLIFDLNTVKLDKSDMPETKIMLTGTLGIKMKFPTFENVKKLEKILQKNDIGALFDSIHDFVDYVFDGETIYDQFTVEEFGLWLETLNNDQFNKVNGFFKSIPKLKAEINLCCEKCGATETVTREGLLSFLA